jgi:hypothetical protein
MSKIVNATIDGATITTERGLSAWIHLDYGNGLHQSFGGYLLYAPPGWVGHDTQPNVGGHFFWRCLEVVGVETWAALFDKAIRVRLGDGYNSTIEAIGHITKDVWFEPVKEFAALKRAQ